MELMQQELHVQDEQQEEAEQVHPYPRGWPRTSTWTTLDVANFVRDSGFSQYAIHFRRNAVNGRDLENMDAMGLQRLGVTHLPSALKLMRVIQDAVSTMGYNLEDPDTPLNMSYYPRNPASQPASGSEGPNLPVVPAPRHPFNPRQLTMPFKNPSGCPQYYELKGGSKDNHCSILKRANDEGFYRDDNHQLDYKTPGAPASK